MEFKIASPEEWLTDSGLTDQGRQARKTYSRFASYLNSLPMPDFKVSRAFHLLQSHGYDTIPEGYCLPPHTINLSLNNYCNLKCEYCDLSREKEHWEDKNTKADYSIIDPFVRHELPLETCKDIIDQVEWFKPVIRAHWMESLLYPDLLPLIEYTKSKNLPFSMITNGLLLPKFAERLAERDVDALRVSLDGPAEMHDSLCRVPGCYDLVLEGLRKFIDASHARGKHDVQVGAYFTVTDKNYHTMLEMIEDLDRRGILQDMYVGFFLLTYISKEMVEAHNREHAAVCGAMVEETSIQYADVTKVDPDKLMALKDEIKKRYVSKGARIHFRPDFNRDNLDYCLSPAAIELPNARCETHWHSLCINPDGLIKPMSQCILDPCGDVNEHSLMDIWNGEVLRDQRLKLQEYGAYHGCMRCWSIYSAIEDSQGSWRDLTKVQQRMAS